MNPTKSRNRRLPLYYASRNTFDIANKNYQDLINYFMATGSTNPAFSGLNLDSDEVLNEVQNLAGVWDLVKRTPVRPGTLRPGGNLAGEWDLVKPTPIRPGGNVAGKWEMIKRTPVRSPLGQWEYIDAAMSPYGYLNLAKKFSDYSTFGDMKWYEYLFNITPIGPFLNLWNQLQNAKDQEEKEKIKQTAYELYQSGILSPEEYKSILLEEKPSTDWAKYAIYVLGGGMIFLLIILLVMK